MEDKKTMKNFIKTFMLALAVAAGAASCSDKDVESSVVEGLPVTVNLTINVPQTDEVAITRATDEAETKVEKLALFFYRKSFPQNKPVVYEITNLGNPTATTSTNYKYTVSLTTDETGDNALCSGNWYLYAIANYDKKFCSVSYDDLKDMTKAQMDAALTSGSSDQDFVETSVLMSGKYGSNGGLLTLKAGDNTLSESIKLRRLIAKSIFTFKAGSGVTFTPVSYEVHQYSTSSTLMEREGWNNFDPGELTYAGNDGGIVTSTASIPITSTDGSFFFYTQENAQTSNSEVTAYNLREAHKTADDQSFQYAPANASYVVVKGLYEGPLSQSDNTNVKADVTYTIHLGDFSTKTGSNGNFTVRRNTKYNYTVTVNGVNSIAVEAQANDFTEKQPGAEGVVTNTTGFNEILDAHYEQILLELSIPSSNFDNYAVRISTPKGTETIKANGTATIDYDWVKFGKPASTSTFQTYANVKSKLLNINDLLSQLRTNSTSSTDYYIVSGGKVYVAAYVDEYIYSDLALDKFVNADDRQMTLAEVISTSKDGKSVYTQNALFTLRQRSIKSPFSLTLNNPFGLETVEEITSLSTSSTLSSSATDYNDGLKNTRAAVSSSAKWSTYVDESVNGWLPGETTRHDAMKSSYKKYGFLQRNRDENGDGIIDQSEIKWYVPAVNQCLYLWIGIDALPVQTVDVVKNIKKNSTADTKQQWNYLTSTNDKCTWWAAEGTAFGGNASDVGHLCVVRNLGNTTDTGTSEIASYKEADRTITVDGLSSSCYRQNIMTGEYVMHSVGESADKVYKKFKVYDKTLGDGKLTNDDVKSSYVVSSNISDDDKAYWRIPNEKEFALMYITGANTTAKTAARTYYKGNSSTVFYYSGGNITTASGASSLYVLPVRDIAE